MTAFPKLVQVVDPAYLRWCRAHACAFCEAPPQSAPHHTIFKRMGCAVVRDDWTVPVCGVCHMRCHLAHLVNGRSPIPRMVQLRAAWRHRRRFLREQRLNQVVTAIPF